MQKLSDAMSNVMENLKKSGRMESTSNYCEHESIASLGRTITKRYQKLMFDGIEVCPKCESERETEELEKKESARLNRALFSKNYLTLESKSLFKDKTLIRATFKNYECSPNSEEETNKARAIKAVNQYRSGNKFNTLFHGDPGVGKSHLAMSIIRNMNETDNQDRTCLFIDIDEMLSRVRDSFSNKESIYTERYFIQLLSKVDFLVLDDLGAETGATGTDKKASDYTIRILKGIADSRQDKSTIFTTNLDRESLCRMYDAKTVSRLLRDTYVIKFENTSDKRIRNINF
ncbi:ATP-binding protein [Sporosarcina sp. P33]|uniref:ATP-binding protein n=1 Tax=Sporosarcina sp. P33 TaxID=1930764 RepID=UPI0009C18416|nr:ATP-binding protein [Sporosarcina sp. P33]